MSGQKARSDQILQLFSPFDIRERSEKISDYSEYHSSSGSFYEIFPKRCSDVYKIISLAHQHRVFLRIRGNGHSCNGSSIPKKRELLIRSDFLNRYSFEEPNSVTVEAGAGVWDLKNALETHGCDLTVYNGFYSAPSVGGYISAGGVGGKGDDNGFWNIVEEIEFVTAEGRVISCKKDDPLFPWLFGSMGQLGCFTKVKIRIVPRRKGVYPCGVKGRVKTTEPYPLKKYGFSLLTSVSKERLATSLLRKYQKEQLDFRFLCESTCAHLKFRHFNPPLLYPFAGDFVLCSVWGSSKNPDGIDAKEHLSLENEFHKIMLKDPSFRRYIQSEFTPKNFDYRTYFGEKVYKKFQEIKGALDPLGLINRGIL